MICFLTSSPVIPDTETLNPANGFVRELKGRLPEETEALFICSDPASTEKTDHFSASLKTTFEAAGFRFSAWRVLDGRNPEQAGTLIRSAGLLILAGGHVPTQNRFFHSVGLKELLKAWDGVIIGISAGSMNSATTVYAQPELPGETADPAFRRFIPGLGLTETMLLPHMNFLRYDTLDGLRIFEDIAFPDSEGRTVWAVPDGSYLFIADGKEELRGEAWRIRDGAMTRIAKEGEITTDLE